MTDETIRDEVEKKQQTKNPIKDSTTHGSMVLLHVCVCLREKGINNSHQSSTSCLSQQLVCRRAVRIINYTHTHAHTQAAHTHTTSHYIITVNSCRAGRASTQITSLSQVFFNNVPPSSPPGPSLHKEPKGIWRPSLVWSPQPHHRPLNTPLLFTLLRWPLTLEDVSERSWGERLSVDSGSGGKRVLGNEWEVCVNVCVYGLKRVLVSTFFGAFVCPQLG